MRKVRVLINPRSGVGFSPMAVMQAISSHWEDGTTDVQFQFSLSVADGQAKVRRALADGVQTILVVGGDGMVNTIGAELVGTSTELGVVPVGSGNGMARHFGIPLEPAKAAEALRTARPCDIDVARANGRPFFATCSLAADARVVETFQKSPIRGIVPYMFAAAYELFDYAPQPTRVALDGGEEIEFPEPIVFTVANLTQYGNGARIAPQARPDDGFLELVVVQRKDLGLVLPLFTSLFDGTFDRAPGVFTRRFRELVVRRERPGPIQVDGELAEPSREVTIRVQPRAVRILVPVQAEEASTNSSWRLP